MQIWTEEIREEREEVTSLKRKQNLRVMKSTARRDEWKTSFARV